MENIIVYIYNKELELIGQPYITSYDDFVSNPQGFYPTWDEENMYVSKDKLQYPIVEDNLLREKTQKELKLEGIIELDDGEYIEDGKLIVVEYDDKLGYLKRMWNKETHIWYEGATEKEIAEHMGVLVTKLLYDVLAIGCEVTIQEEKHQQSLEKSKREALDEQIGGIKLAEELGEPITMIMWPFKDDGSDTITMAINEFKQMVFECHNYGQSCYIAAELLKVKRKVNSTIDDFYNELKNVKEISLANL
ncbi:hypothetical protein [Fusobacterium mortiferum]|uniref:hypothetical protein n=1 Tax=Fusobacterium mortiferum TaxID=850 RepID=UPI0022E3135C|nr:hypothetical protein [Fusobacterium mortiferum]